MSDADEVREAARRACLRAALDAYEDAGLAGLCAEGRWEAAVDAIRSADLEASTPDDEGNAVVPTEEPGGR